MVEVMVKKSKWTITHEAKYGGKEGLSAEMARRRALNTTTPYFATLNKEQLAEYAKKSHETRNKKTTTSKDETTS